MSPERFWSSSPRELGRAFEAARLRQLDRHDRDIAQAWAAVAIYFSALGKRKLPSLQSLLIARKRRDTGKKAKADRLAMLAFVEAHNMRVRKDQKKATKKAKG